MNYEKPALSISEQIALLLRRGMSVEDEAYARHCLQFITYYRLRPYWQPFEIVDAESGVCVFLEGVSFEDVLVLYVFDRQLRLLVLDAVERVEVALRGAWVQRMATAHGPHGYLEPNLYHREDWHAKAIAKLDHRFRNSQDNVFVRRYRDRYASPELPPVWMAAELMSFGQLANLISNLKLRADRKAIADLFGISESALVSFVIHASFIRNICAHHERLWNAKFILTMTTRRLPLDLQNAMQGADARKLHNTLVMLDYLLAVIAPKTQWSRRVVDLIDGCPLADPSSMGFPEDWRTRPVWKV